MRLRVQEAALYALHCIHSSVIRYRTDLTPQNHANFKNLKNLKNHEFL